MPSLVSPSPTRRKYSYKVMGQLRERFTLPTCSTPYQDKKDYDEEHQDDGGRYWCCSVKKKDRGRVPSLPDLVEVACASMHED